MQHIIDESKNEITLDNGEKIALYSVEGFKFISDLWVKIGWDQKYMYAFSWMGRPLIQIPDDALRIQEVIYSLKPDVIIETGIAHGGSLILSATVCKVIGKGRVIGVDIEIRPHNRKAIEEHELFPFITLIEGDSKSAKTVNQIKNMVNPSEKTLIILDSAHTYDHVLGELNAYADLVSVGSYIVATDGSQEYLNCTPRAQIEYKDCNTWPKNNPKKAAEDFVKQDSRFIIEEPKFPFNEGPVNFRITHWPSAFIKRIK